MARKKTATFTIEPTTWATYGALVTEHFGKDKMSWRIQTLVAEDVKNLSGEAPDVNVNKAEIQKQLSNFIDQCDSLRKKLKDSDKYNELVELATLLGLDKKAFTNWEEVSHKLLKLNLHLEGKVWKDSEGNAVPVFRGSEDHVDRFVHLLELDRKKVQVRSSLRKIQMNRLQPEAHAPVRIPA